MPVYSRICRAISATIPLPGVLLASTCYIPTIVEKVVVSTIKERPAEIAIRSIFPLPPASNATPATIQVEEMVEMEAENGAYFWLYIKG